MDTHQERLDIEARVITSDNQNVGTVSRVVVDPKRREVIDIVVHWRKTVLESRDIVVPVRAVEQATEGEVRLRLSAAELAKYPDFVHTDYVSAPPRFFIPTPFTTGGILWPAGPGAIAITETAHENIPKGSIAISEGTAVECPDGQVGTVDEVIVDPADQQALGIVVRLGTLFTHDVFIPLDWVARVTPDRVLLNRTKPEVEHLRPYCRS